MDMLLKKYADTGQVTPNVFPMNIGGDLFPFRVHSQGSCTKRSISFTSDRIDDRSSTNYYKTPMTWTGH